MPTHRDFPPDNQYRREGLTPRQIALLLATALDRQRSTLDDVATALDHLGAELVEEERPFAAEKLAEIGEELSEFL